MRSSTGAPDRVALVTGAARGIGAATARLLARQGTYVVAFDWATGDDPPEVPYPQATREDLEQVAASLGDRGVAVTGDVRDRQDLDRAVRTALDRWGRLDVAVAGAAVILGGRPLWETPPDDSKLLWQIDVEGVWHTAAATVPHMLSGPAPHGCRFVAIASAAAEHGLFHLTAYNAAKHAVVGIVRGLSADLTGTGVTATAVSPGSTRTPMLEATAALYDVPGTEDFAASQRIRRLITPEEVAATVGFCCSPEGAVTNGSVVHADGGFTA